MLHRKKQEALHLAADLVDWMRERDVEPVMLPGEAESAGRADAAGGEGLSSAAIIVTLGGDGTLLRAARLVLGSGVPVLGINLGRLGFLAEVDRDSIWQAMEKVLTQRYRVEKRSVLACHAFAGEEEIGSCRAINEIVVGGGGRNRLVALPLEINGELFNRYYCDGLILSTPTGSTAYSLSAGGPFVSPETRLFIVTPICAHSLLNRSLILAETEEVTIRLPEGDVEIHTDGERVGFADTTAERIVISSSPDKFHLARIDEHSFFTVLRRKLAIWDALGEEG